MRLPLLLLLLPAASLAFQCITGHLAFTPKGPPEAHPIECDAKTCILQTDKSTERLIFSCGTEDVCPSVGCTVNSDGDAVCCCQGHLCNVTPTPETQKITGALKSAKRVVEEEKEEKEEKEEEKQKDEKEEKKFNPVVHDEYEHTAREWVEKEIEKFEKIIAAQEPDPIPVIPKIPQPPYVPAPREGEEEKEDVVAEETTPAVRRRRPVTCVRGRTMHGKPFRMANEKTGGIVMCSIGCSRNVSKLHGEVMDWVFGCAPTTDFCFGKPRCKNFYTGNKNQTDCCCKSSFCNQFVKGSEAAMRRDLEKSRIRGVKRLKILLDDLKEALHEVDVDDIIDKDSMSQQEKEAVGFGEAAQILAEGASDGKIEDEHKLRKYLTEAGQKELLRELYEEYKEKRNELEKKPFTGVWVKQPIDDEWEKRKEKALGRKESNWKKMREYVGQAVNKAADWLQTPSKWINKD